MKQPGVADVSNFSAKEPAGICRDALQRNLCSRISRCGGVLREPDPSSSDSRVRAFASFASGGKCDTAALVRLDRQRWSFLESLGLSVNQTLASAQSAQTRRAAILQGLHRSA